MIASLNSAASVREVDVTDTTYRDQQIKAYQDLSLSYAKTLVTLAGGALAASVAFLGDVIEEIGTAKVWLIASWGAWALSLTIVLLSYYWGRQAAFVAIKQHDNNELQGANPARPGGAWATAVNWCGVLSLIAFVAGVVLFLVYVYFATGVVSNVGEE
jgi:hypothetical protein